MVSGTFWLVLLGAVAINWLLPRRMRTALSAALSMCFLATLDRWATIYLIAWAITFFNFVPLAKRNDWIGRCTFVGLLLGILGFLGWFKYAQPMMHAPPESPPLIPYFFYTPELTHKLIPLGISYFTFKLIHYLIEVSRGNMESGSLQDYLAYMALFPIFPAGPIERFDRFVNQRDQQLSVDTISTGVWRIQCGLIKKFCIADVFILPLMQEPSTATIVHNLDIVPVFQLWLHLTYYFIYAYMDFSGYSDIAIGAARLFGYRICENFNFPFLATDIGNFWKRWHMSLASWCQAYVYMPTLGLARNPYLAVFATMLTIAVWHEGSWHWIAWGLYHAVGITVFLTWSRFQRKRKLTWSTQPTYVLISRIATLAFVISSFAFMAAANQGGLLVALRILAKLVAIDV